MPEPTREQRLISAIKEWTDERLIGDDCAVLPGQTLVTTDMLVEGTHFLRNGISMRDLGWKSMAVNLSDIAAMAGRPRYAVISLALPADISDLDVESLFQGFIECARSYRCRIVGGDLTRGRDIVISITMNGDAHECGVLLRSGARPGDVVVVTGDFGAAAAGLWLIKNDRAVVPAEARAFCLNRHWRPLPRLCESWALIRCSQGRGALMDASDGLADALVQISAASGIGITVEQSLVPIASQTRAVAAAAGVDALEWALYGGEDYELVGTLRPADWEALKRAAHNPFRAIGTVTSTGEVLLKSTTGEYENISLSRSFQHWQ